MCDNEWQESHNGTERTDRRSKFTVNWTLQRAQPYLDIIGLQFTVFVQAFHETSGSDDLKVGRIDGRQVFFSPALRGISVILCVFWQEYSLLLTLPVWFDRLIGRTINMANICSFIICKNRPIFSLPTQKKATIMTAKHPHISIKKWLLNSLDIFFRLIRS